MQAFNVSCSVPFISFPFVCKGVYRGYTLRCPQMTIYLICMSEVVYPIISIVIKMLKQMILSFFLCFYGDVKWICEDDNFSQNSVVRHAHNLNTWVKFISQYFLKWWQERKQSCLLLANLKKCSLLLYCLQQKIFCVNTNTFIGEYGTQIKYWNFSWI